MCRRCGAPLHNDVDDARLTVPATLTRRRPALRSTGVATTAAPPPTPMAAAAAAALRSVSPDTLLPGAMPRPDNLLPRPARASAAPARTHRPASARSRSGSRPRLVAPPRWRHVLALAIVAVAITTSVVAVWPVVFGSNASSSSSSATAEARASALLRTVVGGGRTLFAPHRTFAGVSASALSARSYHVPVVAGTSVARTGQVSMSVTSATVMTFATPADAGRCVFARDEPTRAQTVFVTVPTAACRADAAPLEGWHTP